MAGCILCPRSCGADRSSSTSLTRNGSGLGFCGAPAALEVSAVCIHRGEEPPLNPIVNVFFSHCNLHCIYCQNSDISAASVDPAYVHYRTVDSLADKINALLSSLSEEMGECPGAPLLGLVTAAHYADLIPALLEAIHTRLSVSPTVVYNSSGYESVDTLRSLEGLVDIYLPDFKYMDSVLAARYSHAPDYPDVATAALMEMTRQVGTGLKTDDNGIAYRGLIVRHLVLPGHVDNSLAVLDHLADPSVCSSLPTLSLMAQYYPPSATLPAPLDRTLTQEEYDTVANRYNILGFDGWLQELQSQSNYRPDFSRTENPFTP